MSKSILRHTRKTRRRNKLKLKGRGGYRPHKRIAGRTGSIQSKKRGGLKRAVAIERSQTQYLSKTPSASPGERE